MGCRPSANAAITGVLVLSLAGAFLTLLVEVARGRPLRDAASRVSGARARRLASGAALVPRLRRNESLIIIGDAKGHARESAKSASNHNFAG